MATNSSPVFPYPGGTPGAEPPDPVAGKPGHFAWSNWIKQYVKNLNSNLMAHQDSTDPHPNWAGGGGGGGDPTGAAGGDLTGNYPNPQIAVGAIVDNDVNTNAAIAITKIWNLRSELDDKASAGHTHEHDPTLIPKSVVTAKGDLIVGVAANTVTRLPVGTTNGYALTVNSAAPNGVAWAAQTGSANVDEVLALPVGAAVPPGTLTGTLIVRYQ